MRPNILKWAKRWLYLVHRWLGVVTCVFCVMWFLSGLVMLYVPFLSWSDDERMTNLPPVATARVRVLPDDAIARSGVTTFPTTFRLETFKEAPVYRIVTGDRRVSLSAVTGEVIKDVGPRDAESHIQVTFPDARPALLGRVDYDQWTVSQRFDAHRPLLKFALGDPENTIVYVSSSTGEIVQNATRKERIWNWLGAIPHWIYFTPIRKDQALWRQAVMWLSGPLVIGAISGLWIGILRLRVRKRYARDRMTPYRGWMKWHHLGGLIGGLFLTTWIASGWLSVNPFGLFARTTLTEVQRSAFAGWSEGMAYGVTDSALAAVPPDASDITFLSMEGRPFILARDTSHARLLDARTGAPSTISGATLIAAAQGILTSTPIVRAQHLAAEDVYWYSHHTKRPLPVLKVTFADPSATWLFINPATGEIAGLSDKSARTYRWLFNFLHDYDLPVLLRNQPARDALVWILSLAGLVVSMSGVVLGYRALKRRNGQQPDRRRRQAAMR